jgi:ribosome maturation factor RimP
MSKKVITVTEQLVLPILRSMDMELVDIEYVKEGANWFLRVYIDKEGGVDIEDCSRVSEILSKKLDEVDPIPEAYFLEVSSPGAERPLRNEKDYIKAVGKAVHIETREPVEGDTVFEGILKAREDDHLTIEVGKKEIKIPIPLIEKARLAILF